VEPLVLLPLNCTDKPFVITANRWEMMKDQLICSWTKLFTYPQTKFSTENHYLLAPRFLKIRIWSRFLNTIPLKYTRNLNKRLDITLESPALSLASFCFFLPTRNVNFSFGYHQNKNQRNLTATAVINCIFEAFLNLILDFLVSFWSIRTPRIVLVSAL
jgi:uncharacterized RDD family membrane protein YckC